MKQKVLFRDLGVMDYMEAWQYQEALFNRSVSLKGLGRDDEIENYLLFCEHPHVYTLGKSGSEKNLLINALQIKNKNAAFYRTNRGGDITYHGPGQIVGYLIFDLSKFKLGVKDYVDKIEESIIRTLNNFGITAQRLRGATGVWLEADTADARKICAIGVRCSRYISMHGFALNVNTDLDYFSHINPCGFTDKKVTSLSAEMHQKMNVDDVKIVLKEKIAETFDSFEYL